MKQQKKYKTAATKETTAPKRSEPKTAVQKRRGMKKQKSNAPAVTTAQTTTKSSEPETTLQKTETQQSNEQDQVTTPKTPSARAAKRPRDEGDDEAPRPPSKITKFFFPRARQDRPP
jgi:hypothetical protein